VGTVPGIEEIVLPWYPERSWGKVVQAEAYKPGQVIAGVVFLMSLLPLWFAFAVEGTPIWIRVLDVLLVGAVVALAVWGYRLVMARPESRQRVAVTRLLLSSKEHADTYECLKRACDYMQWFVDEKETVTGQDGKTVVRTRRTYPSIAFVVDLDTVRLVLDAERQPLPPSGIRPSLGQEVRLRFDTTKAGLDSVKLAKGTAVFSSKLGLNGFETSVDFSRGETRHVDIRIAQFPEGDLYARYGRK
jgi:hypothetical protein